ncbi:SUMF1/EgtB/PvdO family nonheme iron enzyme [Pseudenhygromyxa sp. WMMC2535]|uniref:formylglycine-generating enzyme family protein n=1 Tax=Pseudenhygromyxa sp. WMMC2535 TaxID=2712867 RepID=UPI0015540DE4|nr:SUMF1/EgtB/PvdO family nonheme iron enzyme [Pseudenhygromyxa sp. WMMC2535]NVB42300.1 SUMF1/EgtB/PvdO family nonheme iron enzyme [Pseudenhygromyxa sp. WMMC2535]
MPSAEIELPPEPRPATTAVAAAPPVADKPSLEGENERLLVPEGVFLMGATDADLRMARELCLRFGDECPLEWFANEYPQTSEAVGEFWIDRLEVSNADYNACVTAGTCVGGRERGCQIYEAARDASSHSAWRDLRPAELEPFSSPSQPAVCVTRSEAESFCGWLGGRLPTRIEWEKAARGTTGRPWPWGAQEPSCARANHLDDQLGPGCGVLSTVAVGSFPEAASPYGALDMAGNAAEWVAAAKEQAGGKVAIAANEDEIRGGHWASEPVHLRTTESGSFSAGSRMIYVGFRCAYDSPS